MSNPVSTSSRPSAVIGADDVRVLDGLVAQIRGTSWVDPALRPALPSAAADKSIGEHLIVGMLDQLSGLHPQVAAMVLPVKRAIAALIPDQGAVNLVAGGLNRVSAVTHDAERELATAQREMAQRWRSGGASKAVQQHVIDLRMQVAAGSAVSGGLSSVVSQGSLVVVAARVLALGVAKAAAGAALIWVQRNAGALLPRGAQGIATIVQQVGGHLQSAVQKIRAILQALLNSQGALAGLARRLTDVLLTGQPAVSPSRKTGAQNRTGGTNPSGEPPKPQSERARRTAEIFQQMSADAAAVNPQWRTGGEAYQLNCANTSVTFEWRRRGVDVVAQPVDPDMVRTGGRFTLEIEYFMKGKFQPASHEGVTEAFEEFGPGSRGIVYVQYRTGGGHFFNVENVNGLVMYPDAQSGVANDPGNFDGAKSVSFLRTDHLPLDRKDMVDFIKSR